MIGVAGIWAGIVAVASLGSAPARAQQVDSTRVVVDTTARRIAEAARPTDSTRAVDSLRKAQTAESTGEVAEANSSLRALGTVDAPVRLSADLSEKRLTVIAGNNAVRTFTVAVGTAAKPTPTGTFTIRKIVWNPSWIPPDEKWARGKTAKGPGEAGNPMKVAKIFFREPDYYIHGTGQVNSLGTADSHGCIRMSPDEVAELAQFLMQNGGQPREEGWFSRVVHLRYKTHTIYLDKPITLTISK